MFHLPSLVRHLCITNSTHPKKAVTQSREDHNVEWDNFLNSLWSSKNIHNKSNLSSYTIQTLHFKDNNRTYMLFLPFRWTQWILPDINSWGSMVIYKPHKNTSVFRGGEIPKHHVSGTCIITTAPLNHRLRYGTSQEIKRLLEGKQKNTVTVVKKREQTIRITYVWIFQAVLQQIYCKSLLKNN